MNADRVRSAFIRVYLRYSIRNETVLVSGFTVNRTKRVSTFVVAETVELPPTVRVPPFSLGEPCGSS